MFGWLRRRPAAREIPEDMWQQVLLRHSARMASPEASQSAIDTLRARVGSAPARAILGQDSERRPGGVVLRGRAPGDPARAAPSPLDTLEEESETPCDTGAPESSD